MLINDIDITKLLRDSLYTQSFLFNPSIAHLHKDIYFS